MDPRGTCGEQTATIRTRSSGRDAFFAPSGLDTVTAAKTYRGHAIIEQVNADLNGSALAHLPSRAGGGRGCGAPPSTR
jgi:hypothetical protein